MMKALLAAVMAIGLLSLPIEQVAACSCAMLSPAESAASADAVFAGTVVGAREVGARDLPLGAIAATVPGPMPVPMAAVIYTFAVDGVAKGDVTSDAEVLGGGDGASCGMTFSMNERWLVFATWDGAMLNTNLCAGNVVLEAGADAPLPLTAPTDALVDEGFEVPLPALAVLAAIAVVAAISFLAFRPGRGPVAS